MLRFVSCRTPLHSNNVTVGLILLCMCNRPIPMAPWPTSTVGQSQEQVSHTSTPRLSPYPWQRAQRAWRCHLRVSFMMPHGNKGARTLWWRCGSCHFKAMPPCFQTGKFQPAHLSIASCTFTNSSEDPYCICTRTAYSKSVCGEFRPSARDLEQVFNRLKASFGSAAVPEEGSIESYNVVLTSSYMMLVPRSKEVYGLVAVNSMGFAGSMLVRSKAELDFIRSESPMRILAAVGIPWP